MQVAAGHGVDAGLIARTMMGRLMRPFTFGAAPNPKRTKRTLFVLFAHVKANQLDKRLTELLFARSAGPDVGRWRPFRPVPVRRSSGP